MSRRRAAARRVKIHRNYTVEEASAVTGLHKNTIRRWIITGTLPALTEQRPHLILGRDLHAMLNPPKTAPNRLKPCECYCVKCRRAQRPALGMVDYVVLNATTGMLQGLCPDCGTLMYRNASRASLTAIAAV